MLDEFDLDAPLVTTTKLDANRLAIKQLSYSSIGTLHTCPRRFMFDKLLQSLKAESTGSVTFAFGHAVGEGVQQTLLGLSRDEVIWKMFLEWDYDLLESMKAAKKSFPLAVLAVDKFRDAMQSAEDSYFSSHNWDDYEVATIKGKPALELSFEIELPKGYRYRGFIDAVLVHKETGELLVVEIKTTGFTNIHEAMYKNSAQALGYTLVLDTLDNEVSNSFEVLYLVYKTKDQSYEMMPFPKYFNQKVEWVEEMLFTCNEINFRLSQDLFSTRGSGCYSFFKPCKYLDVCGMPNEVLKIDYDAKAVVDNTDYTISIKLEDVIKSLQGETNG